MPTATSAKTIPIQAAGPTHPCDTNQLLTPWMLPRYFRVGVKYTHANAAATTASMISGFQVKPAIRGFRAEVRVVDIQAIRLGKDCCCIYDIEKNGFVKSF
ncbi:MAG: hypothetical protein ABSB22_16855 [Thermodesulfobacteriota bacterium]